MTQQSIFRWVTAGILCGLNFSSVLGAPSNESSKKDNWTPPAGFSAQRYEVLWKRSPFTLSSVNAESSYGFASNFALAGYLKIGSSEFITVINKQSHESFFISNESNPQGIKLVSVQPNADPLKVTARISKSEEIGEVGYDRAILASTTKPNEPVKVAASSSPALSPVINSPQVVQQTQHPPSTGRRILRPTPVAFQN